MYGSLIKKLITEEKGVLTFQCVLHFLCIASDLILFYAAGIVLNALFAGVGVSYSGLIALFASAGAVIGRCLFTYMRDRMQETCFEDVMNYCFDETGDERLSAADCSQDTAFLVSGGVINTLRVLINDVVMAVVSIALCRPGGILLTVTAAAVTFVIYHFGTQNVTDEKKFALRLCGMSELIILAGSTASILAAVFSLKSGGSGIYGCLMISFMALTIFAPHRKLSENMLSYRAAMFSAEQIGELIEKDEDIPLLAGTRYEEKRNTPPALTALHSLLLLARGGTAVFACFVMLAVLEVNDVPDVKAGCICAAVCALGGAALRIFEIRQDIRTDRQTILLSAAAAALIAGLLLLQRNLVLGLLTMSSFAVVLLAMPVLHRLRMPESENTESFTQEYIEDKTEQMRSINRLCMLESVVSGIFLIVIIAAGILLYWQNSARFADIVLAGVIYMTVMLYIYDTAIAVNRKERQDAGTQG